MDFALDGVAESCDVGEGGVVAVNQGECVAGRDSGTTHDEAFVEPGLIEEPGGR
jgi:hypothetical protein